MNPPLRLLRIFLGLLVGLNSFSLILAHDFAPMIDVSVQITGSGNTLSMQARSSLPYYRPDDVSTEEFRQITETYFRENLIVETGQKLCKIRITGVAPDPDNDEKNTLTTGVFVCESEVTSADDVTLRSTLFAELGSDEWYTFVDFSFPAGTKKIILDRERTDFVGKQSQILRYNTPPPDREYPLVETVASVVQTVGEPAVTLSIWHIIGQFIMLGIEHILTGTDHILFVLALIMTVRTISEIMKLTGIFTLAHSVTLILAGMGMIRISAGIVEPIIALSIIALAVENVIFFSRKSPDIVGVKKRLLLAFGFGLFHGLGFAGSLSDITLPADYYLSSLVSFNVGVELGQILVIALALPLLYLANKYRNTWGKTMLIGCSVILSLISVYWFFERLVSTSF